MINKYKWKAKNYPYGKDDWIKLYVNVLCIKNMSIYLAYISEHNLNYENQITLLMIPNREGW